MLPMELTDLSSSILSLILLHVCGSLQSIYSKEMEGDLGLYMLNNREQSLLFLKPSPMLLMLFSELITMLMLEFGVRLSEILAITVEVCVIFTNSLIDATI